MYVSLESDGNNEVSQNFFVFVLITSLFLVGKLIRLVPHPVMLGFVNGLAIIMTKAQLTHFKSAGKFLSLVSPEGRYTYVCALLTMALVRFGIPKVQEKVEAIKAIPPTLGGVIISAALARVFKWPIKTLAGKSYFMIRIHVFSIKSRRLGCFI